MTLRCWSLVSRPWHYQRNPNISNYPFLSFDIETNSMRKCLLKLFSLLQKKSSSHHHSNIQIAEERIDLSKYPPACLPEYGQQLKVNTSAFVYGGYWLSSTIDGNMKQFKTKNAKKIFLATMRAMHRMGKTWRGVFSDNSSKNRGEQLCIVHRCSFQVIKASFIYLTNYTFVWSFTLVFRNTYFRSW